LELGKHIGGGSIGVVFKGVWKGRREPVAIKKVITS
jgi:hypothetical protein